MLSAKEIIESRNKSPPKIPSFGVKDFEPNGTLEQSYQIQNSICEIKNVLSQSSVKVLNTLSQAVWQPELQLAEVTQQVGSHWTYMGHNIEQKLYIYPEEALYLLETGSLQVMYNGVSLSVQRAYFVLFEEQKNITIDKYRVYSTLSSYGYKVLRHSPKNTVTKYEKQLEVHKIGIKLKDYHSDKHTEKRQIDIDQCLRSNKKLKVDEPIIFPITYEKNEANIDILKKIKFIQPYKNNSETSLNFDYDVYSETYNKSFKKSCLQLPSLRVIIHKGEDSIPNFEELCKLSNKCKDEVPVIHAIVFIDCIVFYKIDPVNLPDVYE